MSALDFISQRTPRSPAGARFTPLGSAPSAASRAARADAAITAIVTDADMSTAAVSAAPVADGGGRVRGAEGTGDAVRPAGTCFAHWASNASHHAKGRPAGRSDAVVG